MPTIIICTLVDATRERAFDLARDVDVHVRSMEHTGETVVAAPRRLLDLGDEVTWRARHLGVVQELTSRISLFDRPARFRDSMVRGAFARFDHDHLFRTRDGATEMIDVFDFTSPFGLIGRVAEAAFLERYMERLLDERARTIARLARDGR